MIKNRNANKHNQGLILNNNGESVERAYEHKSRLNFSRNCGFTQKMVLTN